MGPADLAADVALVARALADLGFVHAFGHVSARAVDNPERPDSPSATVPLRGAAQPEGGFPRAREREGASLPRARGWRVLLTPTAPPLGEVAGGEVLELDREGRVLRGVAGNRPLEAALHLAVYEAQPGVGAICRVQAPAISASATVGAVPPLLHGFGGMVEPVAWWDDPDLVTDGPVAERVAAALGEAPAMLLAGNGGLTVGADLDQALARAWCLEDRCRVALFAGDRGRPLPAEALERRRRWYDAETARLARWLRAPGGP
jgi:HCOMODA/2-hydroxy-3-carboxy-muconic semialdehyde decarboxylase